MKFDFTNNKNGVKCKKLEEWMKITNNLKWYRQCKLLWAISYCLCSYWTHAFWWWTRSVWIDTYILVGRLDLIWHSIWFICCKSWIYFISRKYEVWLWSVISIFHVSNCFWKKSTFFFSTMFLLFNSPQK
jgi:hypothetical protein